MSSAQCSKYKKDWRCKNNVKEGTRLLNGVLVPYSLCEHHIAQSKAKRVRDAAQGKGPKPLSEAQKADQKEYQRRPYVVEKRKKYYEDNKVVLIAKNTKRCQQPEWKARRSELQAKHRLNPDYGLNEAIVHKICKMRKGHHSSTVERFTGWKSKEDVMEHFERTFVDGMTRDNFGEWQCGHRIARSMYAGSEEDATRCWNTDNLFAQWAAENNCAKVKLPPDDELAAMRHLWPMAWNDELPSIEKRKELERVAMRGKRAY